VYTVCVDRLPDVPCNASRQIAYANGTCYSDSADMIGIWNQTVFEDVTRLKRTSASEEYYKLVTQLVMLTNLSNAEAVYD